CSMSTRRIGVVFGTLVVVHVLSSCLGDPLQLDPLGKTGTDGSVDHQPFDSNAVSNDAADVQHDADAAGSGGSTAKDAASDVVNETPEAEAGCAKDCLGGACVNGQCQPLLIAPWTADNTLPSSLAVDPAPNGGVFFTTYLGVCVKRAEKDGSGVTVISAFA